MPTLPPHISPEPKPAAAPAIAISDTHDDDDGVPLYSLSGESLTPGEEVDDLADLASTSRRLEAAARRMSATRPPPPELISPAITPPLTPSGTSTPSLRERPPASVAIDSESVEPCVLLPKLPEVQCLVRARIPTVSGSEMFLHLYSNNIDNKEHLAIVFGAHIRSKTLFAHYPGETERDRLIRGAYDGRLHVGRVKSEQQKAGEGRAGGQAVQAQLPLVRIHSECYTGETAWSARCDCGEQLDEAARLMSQPSQAEAGGVIVYLRQEGRGIGLGEKLKAYNLQDLGSDTVEANLLLRHPADARSYGLATAILEDLGLGGDRGIRLLTNNPDKVAAVEGPNREVVVKERVAMVPLAWKAAGKGIQSAEIEQYLRTKIGKMGHMLDGPA